MSEPDATPERESTHDAESAHGAGPVPVRRRIRWVRVSALIVVVVAAAAAVLFVAPEALKPHANSEACTAYATVYAGYVTSVEKAKSTGDRSALDDATTALPQRLASVLSQSRGQVRDAVAASRRAATAHAANPGSVQQTVAFFSSATEVARACDADGSTIHLKQLG